MHLGPKYLKEKKNGKVRVFTHHVEIYMNLLSTVWPIRGVGVFFLSFN